MVLSWYPIPTRTSSEKHKPNVADVLLVLFACFRPNYLFRLCRRCVLDLIHHRSAAAGLITQRDVIPYVLPSVTRRSYLIRGARHRNIGEIQLQNKISSLYERA